MSLVLVVADLLAKEGAGHSSLFIVLPEVFRVLLVSSSSSSF